MEEIFYRIEGLEVDWLTNWFLARDTGLKVRGYMECKGDTSRAPGPYRNESFEVLKNVKGGYQPS